jgi:alpha-glucosidase (family GH31 glycosyl hydrolase)
MEQVVVLLSSWFLDDYHFKAFRWDISCFPRVPERIVDKNKKGISVCRMSRR